LIPTTRWARGTSSREANGHDADFHDMRAGSIAWLVSFAVVPPDVLGGFEAPASHISCMPLGQGSHSPTSQEWKLVGHHALFKVSWIGRQRRVKCLATDVARVISSRTSTRRRRPVRSMLHQVLLHPTWRCAATTAPSTAAPAAALATASRACRKPCNVQRPTRRTDGGTRPPHDRAAHVATQHGRAGHRCNAAVRAIATSLCPGLTQASWTAAWRRRRTNKRRRQWHESS